MKRRFNAHALDGLPDVSVLATHLDFGNNAP
jgi:hypothetical protein